MNFNKDEDDKYIEPNMPHEDIVERKENGTRAETIAAFMSEADYFIEEKVWYKIWKEECKSLLKNEDIKHLNVTDQPYGIKGDNTYKAVLFNNSNGLASFMNSTEKDEDDNRVYVYNNVKFGWGGYNNGGHPDYYHKVMSDKDSDDHFADTLNYEDKTDLIEVIGKVCLAIGVVALVVVAAPLAVSGIAGTLASAGALGASAGGAAIGGAAIMSGAFITAVGTGLMFLFGVKFIALGVAAAIGTARIWVATREMPSQDPEDRPRGVAFSKSGLFESILLRNGALMPPSIRPSTMEEAESDELLLKFSSSLFGVAPNDNFMLRPAPGNGHEFHGFNFATIRDKFTEIFQSIVGFLTFWNDDDNEADGTLSDEDYYKPFQFTFNSRAGNYGGIFKTTTPQRYTIFSLLFARIYYKSLAIRYLAQEGNFEVKYYPTCWLGMADALEGKPKDSDFANNGAYPTLAGIYESSYSETLLFMNRVKQRIHTRRAKILRALNHFRKNALEIREAVRRAEAILEGTSSEISNGEKIAINYLKKTGFGKQGMTFLNDNTAGTLLQHYQRNFLLDFRSDEDESANPDGISVFPFFKKENYDIRDLKLMARLFSEKGRGFTSDSEDNLGRKTIFHIGIPMGLVRALQNEAYQKTNDIDYYYSNNIVIHITKVNDLNPHLKYQARSYVFNMSKYITPFKTTSSYDKINEPGNFTLCNHLKDFDDSWSIEDIKNNTEVMTTFRRKMIYENGVDGIRLISQDNAGAKEFDEAYSNDVFEAMLENHIYDYFSKLYVSATTGLDISETQFPIDRSLVFDGDVDPETESAYHKLVDEIIQRYPSANIVPEEAQKFYRVFKTMRSALYFSAENRYQSCLGTSCFQRIFSIPVSERDFLLKNSDYNLDANEIYDFNDMPKIRLTSQTTGVRKKSVAFLTGTPEVRDNRRLTPLENRANDVQLSAINEYRKVLDPNKTDVSGFTVEIAILKSSKQL